MRIVVGGRLEGKTAGMIRMMRLHPEMVAVCITEREADRLRKITEGEIEPNRFVAFRGLLDGTLRGGPRKRLYLDNADMMLTMLAVPHRVDAITMTGPTYYPATDVEGEWLDVGDPSDWQ